MTEMMSGKTISAPDPGGLVNSVPREGVEPSEVVILVFESVAVMVLSGEL